MKEGAQCANGQLPTQLIHFPRRARPPLFSLPNERGIEEDIATFTSPSPQNIVINRVDLYLNTDYSFGNHI